MKSSMKAMKWAVSVALVVTGASAHADEKVELPPEELAKESVLPVFDRPVSVRSRNVVTAERVDMHLSYGLALSEPVFNVNRIGLGIYYNTSENHAFGLLYAKNTSGLSTYANQLHEQFNLDFSRAPAPNQTIMGDWNMKMFYGKMSLTKDTVFNLSLYTTLAAGIVQYVHKSYPAIAPGLGQKFYFGSNFAVRFDMRLFMHQAPIPFMVSTSTGGLHDEPYTGHPAGDPVPDYGSFSERLTFTTMLDAGISWLF